MNKPSEQLFDGTPASLLGRTLCTPMRCQVFSASIALVIIGCMVAVVQNKLWFAKDSVHSSEQVEDSIKLVSESKQWRDKYAELVSFSRQTSGRITEVRRWLPKEIDWREAEDRIRTVAIKCNVQVTVDRKGDSRRGKRVGIVPANCIVNGSYEDVCQFLHELPNLERPIWCSSIRIIRESTGCIATLKLRMPYAAKDTVAEKLFAAGASHAS